MKFNTPEEMLNTILSGTDLYSPKTKQYVFVYNDSGSICVYTHIDKKFANEHKNSDEYWGADLGLQNSFIYDSEEYYCKYRNEAILNNAKAEKILNIHWCEENYTLKDWEDVSPKFCT